MVVLLSGFVSITQMIRMEINNKDFTRLQKSSQEENHSWSAAKPLESGAFPARGSLQDSSFTLTGGFVLPWSCSIIVVGEMIMTTGLESRRIDLG